MVTRKNRVERSGSVDLSGFVEFLRNFLESGDVDQHREPHIAPDIDDDHAEPREVVAVQPVHRPAANCLQVVVDDAGVFLEQRLPDDGDIDQCHQRRKEVRRPEDVGEDLRHPLIHQRREEESERVDEDDGCSDVDHRVEVHDPEPGVGEQPGVVVQTDELRWRDHIERRQAEPGDGDKGAEHEDDEAEDGWCDEEVADDGFLASDAHAGEAHAPRPPGVGTDGDSLISHCRQPLSLHCSPSSVQSSGLRPPSPIAALAGTPAPAW